MTFVITALAVDGRPQPLPQTSPLVLEEVAEAEAGSSRAGYIPGLARHLDNAPQGVAYHVLLPDDDGWMSSNALFVLPEDEDAPGFLRVPDELRGTFSTILDAMQRCSPIGRVILILEYNGSVTAGDADEKTASMVDVVGPLSVAEFWRLHDLQQILEEAIVIVDGGR